MPRHGPLVVLAILVTLAVTAPAAHAQTPWLGADVTHAGVIDLVFTGPPGTNVVFFERVGTHARRLGTVTVPQMGRGRLLEATSWRCDRVVRRFEATAIAPDHTVLHGASAIRTGSCKHRFDMSAPRRARTGSMINIRVTDRWAIGGIDSLLCIDPPRDRRTCRALDFRKAVTLLRRGFRATRPGRWQAELRVRGSRVVRASIYVGRHGGPVAAARPTLLATGDSTMQGIDNFLADRLGERVNVRSDILPGSGISQTARFWYTRAAQQVARFHPRITVMSIGANDFSDMTPLSGPAVACCDIAWVMEYRRRARAMMKTYARHGRGRVLWIALPLPRDPEHAVSISTVNRSIRLAAQGLEGVSILAFDTVFTPNGFSDVIRWRGQFVRVREPDGVHLNLEGTSIAAEVIESFLQRSGWEAANRVQPGRLSG